MSILAKNSSELVDSGLQKIKWTKSYMKVLNKISDIVSESLPFQGITIAISDYLDANIANLACALKAGGADVHVTSADTMSTEDDVAAALDYLGVTVNAVHGADNRSYKRHLTRTLSCNPHIVMDTGGDLLDLLTEDCKENASRLIGGCESTSTGIKRIHAKEAEGTLPCLMFAVDSSKCKQYYSNKYGTGQSVLTAILNITNLSLSGKTVVIAGYSGCGKGIAVRATGMGATVIVTEIDPFEAMDAKLNGFRVMPMKEAARFGDIFITATGCTDVITVDHVRLMHDGVVICNAGHFSNEIDIKNLRRASVVDPETVREFITQYSIPNIDDELIHVNLLTEGRPVNFASGNTQPAEIMDTSCSIQVMIALELVKNYKGRQVDKRLYSVPKNIDEFVGEIKLSTDGINIDHLTAKQEKYMKGYN